MAINNNGTKNSLGENQLPAGYVRPNVTTFQDHEYMRPLQLSIAKATVQNADPAVTMANILTNAAVGITKQVTDLVTAEFINTANVTVYSNLVALGNNYQSMEKGSAAFTDTAAAYLATVHVYIKSV